MIILYDVYIMQKVILVIGEQCSGKSTFLNLICSNTSSLTNLLKHNVIFPESSIDNETETTTNYILKYLLFDIKDNKRFISIKDNKTEICMIDGPGYDSTYAGKSIMTYLNKKFDGNIIQIVSIFWILNMDNPRINCHPINELYREFGMEILEYIHIVYTHNDNIINNACNQYKTKKEILGFIMKTYNAKNKKLTLAFKKFGYIISPFNKTILNWIIDKQDILNLRDEIQQIISTLYYKSSTNIGYKFACQINCEFKSFDNDRKILNAFTKSIEDSKSKILNDFNNTIKFNVQLFNNIDFTKSIFNDWTIINNVMLQYNKYHTFSKIHENNIANQLSSDEKKEIQSNLNVYKDIFNQTIIKHNLIKIDDDGLLYTLNFRKCPECGNITGNIGACSSRKCGFDNDINVDEFISKIKISKLSRKYYDYGCGLSYDWDKGDVVYIYEFGNNLDIEELYRISLFRR